MSDDEIMKALDDEINSCIENHCEEAFTANACLKSMILRLKKENAELRECLKEAADLECTSRGCLSFRDKICHGTYDCGIVKKWRAALEGGNHSND